MMPAQTSREGLAITIQWSEKHLRFVFDRWRNESTAEVSVTTGDPLYSPFLAHERLNLLSGHARETLVRSLRCAAKDLVEDWPGYVTIACRDALRLHRQGDPVERIRPTDPIRPLTYRLDPLLYDEMPTLLFGHGGLGKGYLATYAALLVERGACTPTMIARQGPCLYLDWEWDAHEFRRRVSRLRRGHPELATTETRYLRMRDRLEDALPTIEHIVAEEGIVLLVVDSLLGAVGGDDLLNASTAGRFFLALRALSCAALIIAHVPKNGNGDSSPYGSVFFENLSRSAWEIKKVQEPGDAMVQIGLYHRKCNAARLHRPFGFTVAWGADSTTFTPLDLTDVPEFEETLPLKDRLQRLLATGSKSPDKLMELTGTKGQTVYKALERGEGEWCVRLGEHRGAEWMLIPPANNVRIRQPVEQEMSNSV